MNAPYFSRRPGVEMEAYCTPELICRLHEVAKCIPQLKKTGDNFRIWEIHLKIMIRNLTGSSDYLQHELRKHDPKLNQAAFNLIAWSIDEELLQYCNIDGSAGDAFQVLASRFQPKLSARCNINNSDFPEEILDNIVNMVYHQSAEEHNSIKERKSERVPYNPKTTKSIRLHIYLGHHNPPVLNTIQSLALVNRKFHRLCLPKLWQKVAFPTSLPAPMSLWTEDLLLKHGNLVKSAQFDLEDIGVHQNIPQFPETERGLFDNTLSANGTNYRFRIGLLNIAKIFKVCPSLESVSMSLPPSGQTSEWVSGLAVRLRSPLQLLPQLQHLQLKDHGYKGLSGDFIIDIIKELPSLISLELSSFKFLQKESVEESLGWNLAQLKKLRKLSLECISCEDQTWSLDSWLEPLTNFQLRCCKDMTPDMAHQLLSGRAYFLTKLQIELEEFGDKTDVNVRFDLPTLKTLRVDHYEIINLIVSFEDCKSLEVLEYRGDMYESQWDSLKNLLSRRNWPKLVVLDLRHASLYNESGGWVGKEEVEELFKPFNIRVLLKNN